MTSANNLTKRGLIAKILEMFPDCIKEKKNIKGINHTMFRGLEWNPEAVYPKPPKNAQKKEKLFGENLKKTLTF